VGQFCKFSLGFKFLNLSGNDAAEEKIDKSPVSEWEKIGSIKELEEYATYLLRGHKLANKRGGESTATESPSVQRDDMREVG